MSNINASHFTEAGRVLRRSGQFTLSKALASCLILAAEAGLLSGHRGSRGTIPGAAWSPPTAFLLLRSSVRTRASQGQPGQSPILYQEKAINVSALIL